MIDSISDFPFDIIFIFLQGYHGPPTFFYPKAFVRAKAGVNVVPAEAKTLSDIKQAGNCFIKEGAESVLALRMDGIPKAPDNYFLPRDIIIRK